MPEFIDNQGPLTSGSFRDEPRDRMDRPLRDLRISLLDQCNFRCPYCMPEAEFHKDYAFLSRRERLSHDDPELFAMLSRVFNQNLGERAAELAREMKRGRPRFGFFPA